MIIRTASGAENFTGTITEGSQNRINISQTITKTAPFGKESELDARQSPQDIFKYYGKNKSIDRQQSEQGNCYVDF